MAAASYGHKWPTRRRGGARHGSGRTRARFPRRRSARLLNCSQRHLVGPNCAHAERVLIRDEVGDIVGAIGISGDHPGNDEACAIHGIIGAGLIADGG